MNKNQFKLALKIRLREESKGINLITPLSIDRLSHETIHISVDEIE